MHEGRRAERWLAGRISTSRANLTAALLPDQPDDRDPQIGVEEVLSALP
jgi:hypothetical protein